MEQIEVNAPLKKITDKIELWIEHLLRMLPNLVVSIIVLVIFFILARFLKRLFGRFIRRLTHNRVLQELFTAAIYFAVIALGFFIVLGILNLDKTVTSLLAGIGVVGLVLGFAFQDIASNFVAGIILAFRTPFKLNDIIETSDAKGVVIASNLRYTTVQTFTGQEIYIPNKILIQYAITNYSVEGMRRVDLVVGVSYAEDLRKVRQIVYEAIKTIEGIISEKGIEITFHAFNDSSIDFTAHFWVPYPTNMSFLIKQSEAVIAIKEAFDRNDITIPFPIRTLDFGIKGGKALSEMDVIIRNNNESD